MSHEYVYKISSRYLQKWLRYSMKHVKNWHFSRHFGTLPWFSEFCFLTDFDALKSVLGSLFAFYAKIWPKNMYRSSKSRFFFVWPFSPGDLRWPWPVYYGHKAQEMILTDVSDTIHVDSLAFFALNIEILLADVTKPEKSKILTLTWPVTSSVTSGSNVWHCTGSSRTGLSNGVWNLEIGPVVWEISGGLFAPPPGRTCYYPDPSGARVNITDEVAFGPKILEVPSPQTHVPLRWKIVTWPTSYKTTVVTYKILTDQ